ncbi:MAG: hypothetical protein AB8B81_14825 [Halioglobus sp.]
MAEVVAWFAVAGIGNNASNIGVGDVARRVEYLAFKHAAKNPGSANGLIALTAKDALRLPSGQRVIHLAFRVADGYRLYGMDVQTKRSYGGGRSDSWNSTLGMCVTSDAYHLTNVLDTGESFNVRLKFHQGTPKSMIEFIGNYQFPMTQVSHLPWIKLDYDGQYLSSPIPLPAAWATVNDSGPGHTIQSLLPEHQREYFGIAPGNDCWSGPLAISGDFLGITQGLYIEEHYRRVFIDLPVAQSEIPPP